MGDLLGTKKLIDWTVILWEVEQFLGGSGI